MSENVKTPIPSLGEVLAPAATIITTATAYAFVLSVANQTLYFVLVGSADSLDYLTVADFLDHSALTIIACIIVSFPISSMWLSLYPGKSAQIHQELPAGKFRTGLLSILGALLIWSAIRSLTYAGSTITPDAVKQWVSSGFVLVIFTLLMAQVFMKDEFRKFSLNLFLFATMPFLFAMQSAANDVVEQEKCPVSILAEMSNDETIRGVKIQAIDRGLLTRIDANRSVTLLPWDKISKLTAQRCDGSQMNPPARSGASTSGEAK